jgi:hypothetical protein
MSQVVLAWGNATELAVAKLFDGSPESIQFLTTLISDGKMTPGNTEGHSVLEAMSNTKLQALLRRVFYSYTIPAIWTTAALSVFVMDSGITCDHIDPVTPQYIDAETAHATQVCYNSKLYYLLRATEGPAEECGLGACGDIGCVPTWPCSKKQFTAPPGVDKLGSSQYGYVTVREVIAG